MMDKIGIEDNKGPCLAWKTTLRQEGFQRGFSTIR